MNVQKNAYIRGRKKLTAFDAVVILILTVVALAIIFPFWNTLVIALSTNLSYAKNPVAIWPGEFTWSNFQTIFRSGSGLLVAYKNTILYSLIGTMVSMTIMVMSSYVFSREFPGKRFLFMAAIFTMYFGGGLIPMYLLLKNLKLLNTFSASLLVSLASVYYIIIMKNGFESVPMDLQEAAMIDGANDLTIFARVMLPLQKPLIATFSLFTIVGNWNSWYWPMLTINDASKTLLQIFLRSIINSSRLDVLGMSEDVMAKQFSTGVRMACVFIVILPIMVVYPFLQKYFVKGVLVGAVKM